MRLAQEALGLHPGEVSAKKGEPSPWENQARIWLDSRSGPRVLISFVMRHVCVQTVFSSSTNGLLKAKEQIIIKCPRN
jgi:hypothetical protein